MSRKNVSEFGVPAKKIMLWALLMGLVESMEEADQSWCSTKVANIAPEMGFWSCSETFGSVKDCIWIRDVFNAEEEKIRGPFEPVLNDLIVLHLSKTSNED